MDFNGEGCDDMVLTDSNTMLVKNNILSIEIKATDEIIILPDVVATQYDFIQYKKNVDTPRDVIFTYNGLQKGKIYHHRQQTIIFHKFMPVTGIPVWIT